MTKVNLDNPELYDLLVDKKHKKVRFSNKNTIISQSENKKNSKIIIYFIIFIIISILIAGGIWYYKSNHQIYNDHLSYDTRIKIM